MMEAIKKVEAASCELLCFATFALVYGLRADVVAAQEITFQIENSVSLEQIMTAQDFLTATPQVVERRDAFSGSTSIISQEGTRNSAQNYISRSDNAFSSTLQVGVDNTSIGAIIDSPRSVIAQLQAGGNNFSLVGIVGGADNAVSTLQLGNDLGVSVGLVNSTETKVVYGQAGEGYNGGVVIRNAPPGTVVKLN
tara:strand:- start:4277 stop:4861 length:585 start_codon:yes stop_codon:yes gene_type:complete